MILASWSGFVHYRQCDAGCIAYDIWIRHQSRVMVLMISCIQWMRACDSQLAEQMQFLKRSLPRVRRRTSIRLARANELNS